jgi:hypothetical protein
MLWYLIDDRREGAALVRIRIMRDGKVVRSDFTKVTALGVDPDVMFMDDISRFVQGVLPPPARPVAAPRMRCL